MSPTIVINTSDDAKTVLRKLAENIKQSDPEADYNWQITDNGIFYLPDEAPDESSWGVIRKVYNCVILSSLADLCWEMWLEMFLKIYGFDRVKWSE